jgi:septum formation protein
MRVVLASESFSRKRAMDLIGVRYEVYPSAIDEKAIRDPDPAALTRKLAEAKAWKVAEEIRDGVIVSGDAVVSRAGRIYEKPVDLAEAGRFLSELSGEELEFVTSVAVLRCDTGKMLSTVEASRIRFRVLTQEEIREYIAKYPVLKCAGAFEGDGVMRFAERVEGSFNFVAGVPVSRLIVLLREQGVEI